MVFLKLRATLYVSSKKFGHFRIFFNIDVHLH